MLLLNGFVVRALIIDIKLIIIIITMLYLIVYANLSMSIHLYLFQYNFLEQSIEVNLIAVSKGPEVV